MADVYAVFGTLLALGIAFPGMLTAWWLIFPAVTGRASTRLERSPWKSLLLGGILALPLALVVVILLASPLGPFKFVGAVLLIGALAYASLGVSGLAALMGRRMGAHEGAEISGAAAFVRGALALELAAAFPVIGWLLVIPTVTIMCLGATTFAVLKWMPSGVPLEQSSAQTDSDHPRGRSGRKVGAEGEQPELDPAGA